MSQATRVQEQSARTVVEAGELRVIEARPDRPADRRVGLVHSVTPTGCAVYLIHTAPELATSADVVLPVETGVAAYPVVVQTDLLATVWVSQLGELVGRVNDSTLRAVYEIAWDREKPLPASLTEMGAYVGLELRGILDGRWDFKRTEGAAFRLLTIGLDEIDC